MDECHLRAGERVKMKTVIKEIGKKVVGILPSKMWLSFRFKQRVGYKMDWKNPKTFNQKLQWLKLNDRKDVYTSMVDKYEAKKYVANLIGDEYIIETLGVWDNFDDIDFDKLPDQFVLKCTHDSGGIAIVKDKKQADIKKIGKKIKKALKHNPYTVDREWPYKNVKPRIIAEKYLEDSETKELRDYKFFCFDGVVKALFVASERYSVNSETKFDFFDENYDHLSFTNGHPNADIAPKKPVNFDRMKELASLLSNGFPHLRVDFYEVDEKIYFGELTFYHWSGMTPFVPFRYDELFGSWIDLNLVK